VTREEAIYRLKNMAWLYGSAEREQNIKAIDMAIEALSADAVQVTSKLKNPCDSLLTDDSAECKEHKSKLDLISRADLISDLEEWKKNPNNDDSAVDLVNHFIGIIRATPSADRPSGKWKEMEILCNPYPPVFCVECSECGYRVGRETYLENTFNFCPNCGADMRKGEK